jgi:hypothetical protein
VKSEERKNFYLFSFLFSLLSFNSGSFAAKRSAKVAFLEEQLLPVWERLADFE